MAATDSHSAPPVTKEISVLDGVLVLARHLRLIVLVTLVAIALGVVVALLTPREYDAQAVLVREVQPEMRGAGGLAALRGLGLSLGDAGPGLTVEAYPDILASHEVRAALLDGTFPTASGETISLEAYAEAYGTSLLKSLFRDEAASGQTRAVDDSLAVAYTYDELMALDHLREMMSVDADAETGLMTVRVAARDPVFAAAVVGRLVEELRIRVQAILTQKAREDYEFIRDRASEAERDLARARSRLATFEDRNRGLTSARLLAERSRLQQDVTFAAQVFGEYQSELKQAEIEVQRANPVITIIERPVVPLLPSRPRRKTVVLIWALLGFGLGIVLAFVAAAFEAEGETEPGRRKRDAVRSAFHRALVPGWFRRERVRANTEESGL